MSAALLRKMRDMGLTMDQAIELMDVWEAGCVVAPPVIDITAERRRAKDRERKRTIRGKSADIPQTEAKDVSPIPPSENNPIPPLTGGTFPPKSAQPSPEKPKPEIERWAELIWSTSPQTARRRSGRPALLAALRAAVRDGHDPVSVASGLAGYYASPDATDAEGKFAAGLHVAIRQGRWQAFAEDDDPDPPRGPESPWPQRLLQWRVAQYWNSDWGPKPGREGYLGPPVEERAA